MFGYLIKFAEPVDGFTHGWVYSEARDGRVRVDMRYGTVDGAGEFVWGALKIHHHVLLAGDEMEDFTEQVKAVPHRPAALPDYEYRSDDIRAYLESPKAERDARITARQEARATVLAEVAAASTEEG